MRKKIGFLVTLLGFFGGSASFAIYSVNGIKPISGSTAGGNIITISGTDLAAPVTFQTFGSDYCATMTVYDGTNPSALLTLTDTRNTQSYTIAKLADEKCWMLDNLKIADYVATSADTDLNTISTFSIPILENTGISETDIPHIYGPISGDTGSGSTNYGYAYNWSSATAGETTTSMPGDGTNNDIAPNSICPKNWYLPTAGPVGLDRDYDFLNARMAGLSHTQDEEYLLHYWEYQDNWKFNGPFRGVFASRYSTWYSEGFGVTDQTNGLWSATASSTTPSFAHIMNVNQTYLLPYHTTSRRSGWAVRCLIKTGTTATVLKPTITLDGVTIDSTTVVVSADFASISFPAPAHIAGTTSIVISNGTTGATLDYTFIAPTVPTFPFSPSSSFGGGGGGVILNKDTCPEGDFSPSYYDKKCGTNDTTDNTGTGLLVVSTEHDTLSENNTSDETEVVSAYQRAFTNEITTLQPLEKADPQGLVLRSHLAKMLVHYVSSLENKALGYSEPEKNCSFNDITNETPELQSYIIQACELGLMGIHSDGTPLSAFMPEKTVSRAEFGTVLSRLLRGTTYNDSTPYYLNHLQALKEKGIMTQTEKPQQHIELRQWVRLMLMRSRYNTHFGMGGEKY